MGKKKERAPVYMVRKGHTLVPQMDMDDEQIVAIPEGGVVRVEIKGTRNHDRLRAYWVMLHECVEATGCQPTKEILHKEIKLANGFVEHILFKGLMVQQAASIAFDEMTEDEMVRFFNIATQYLAEEYGWYGEGFLEA
jgi:hypothetical protein